MTASEGDIRSVEALLQRYAAGTREFEQVRLSGADLHNAILHGIDLSEAILNNAVLSRADLRGADLSWADLSGADLRGADLRGAILTRADLTGANLSHANLLKADLSLATLDDANLSEAIFPDGTLQGAMAPPDAAEEFDGDTGISIGLRLYYNPVSFNARRAWIALLEKGISFELVRLNLDGDQLREEFLQVNPFHRVPTLVDGNVTVVESLAILDYIEAIAPYPPLLPREPQALATVRMVELVTANELLPSLMPLVQQAWNAGSPTGDRRQDATARVRTVLSFLERHLGETPFFGGSSLSLADIVAGTAVPWLPQLGVSLSDFPRLAAWCDRLQERPTWQQTQPTAEEIEASQAQVRDLLQRAES